MDREKGLIVLFCIVLPFLLLLLSYKTITFFSLTEQQNAALEGTMGTEYAHREASHLNDVQKVMRNVDYLLYGLLLIVTLVITFCKNNKDLLLTLFRYGGISTVIVISILLLAVTLSFDSSFTLFHQLFFPQGNWQFPAGSPLIEIFPLSFFRSMAMRIIGGTVLLGSIFIVLPTIRKKYKEMMGIQSS